MEKKVKSIYEQLKPFIIYRKDIIDLYNILSFENGVVSIETADYKYKDINDFLNNSEEFITDLNLHRINPHIDLDLNPSSAGIYAYENNFEVLGVCTKLKQVLTNRERKYAFIFENSLLSGCIIGCSTWFYLALMRSFSIYWLSVGVSVLLLGIFLALFSIKRSLKHYSMIFTKIEYGQSLGFLYRKRDELIVALVSAIIGAVISAVVMKLIK